MAARDKRGRGLIHASSNVNISDSQDRQDEETGWAGFMRNDESGMMSDE
jgi:hypothetical protein